VTEPAPTPGHFIRFVGWLREGINSTLLKSNVVQAVTELKEQPGKDIVVLGSGELVKNGLVDEYVLLIHPLILGSGRRLFDDAGAYSALGLTNSVTTTTGVVIATYQASTAKA
jgi:dihydrofolate reductase